MNNYQFCAIFSEEQLSTEGKVLDFGCGRGTVVDLLRKRKFEAYGCDVFYEGGDYRSQVPQPLLAAQIVREIQDDRIPFPDGFFDVVVTNQVFEHVPDLDLVLREIARVLKPGGVLLCLFPDVHCWREGHCGIPFLHWFPKKSASRVYYAWLLRSLGFGLHKDGKARLQWARDFCEWLDRWTHYRRYQEISAAFAAQFGPIQHIEAEWLERRTGRVACAIPAFARALMVRKLVGLVFWSSRR